MQHGPSGTGDGWPRFASGAAQRGWRGSPRRLGIAVPDPAGVPDRAGVVEGLSLREVCSDADRRIWNELMARELSRGAARLFGGAGLFFLGAGTGGAGQLDRLGGDAETAPAAPGGGDEPVSDVRCRNPTSKVLGMALRRLAGDVERPNGDCPVLVETFVDSSKHSGTSLAASNWIQVGPTKGRGRFAETGAQVFVKAVWLRPLAGNRRQQLGFSPPAPAPAQGPGDGLDPEQWAQNEFGGAPLGDARLSQRLVKSAAIGAASPMASFPAAAPGEKAAVAGHCRMIDRPADSALSPENILVPHRAYTRERMQGADRVQCIQDGTDLNSAEHPGCKGLGLVGRCEGGSGTLGLHMHSLPVVGGNDIPLGVPHIQYDAPDGKAERGKPPEARKSQRWLHGLRGCAALAEGLDGVRPVAVMDREADIFALFAEQRRLGCVDIPVRAVHNCPMGPEAPRLFEQVRGQPEQAHLEIHGAGSSARRGSTACSAIEAANAVSPCTEPCSHSPLRSLGSRKRHRLGCCV